jgi:hypothetical protein
MADGYIDLVYICILVNNAFDCNGFGYAINYPVCWCNGENGDWWSGNDD